MHAQEGEVRDGQVLALGVHPHALGLHLGLLPHFAAVRVAHPHRVHGQARPGMGGLRGIGPRLGRHEGGRHPRHAPPHREEAGGALPEEHAPPDGRRRVLAALLRGRGHQHLLVRGQRLARLERREVAPQLRVVEERNAHRVDEDHRVGKGLVGGVRLALAVDGVVGAEPAHVCGGTRAHLDAVAAEGVEDGGGGRGEDHKGDEEGQRRALRPGVAELAEPPEQGAGGEWPERREEQVVVEAPGESGMGQSGQFFWLWAWARR